ncbi:hypothetical protein SAMN05216391_1194 [Lachnospiraceae bacterium KHCPX20]|nr:hypothetical protein SAMN05216391_1194 [Lachnospiraceae bacterium KHCPX20]
MISETWCESFSKPLAVFNKAFIKTKGHGLYPYIILLGTEEDAKYCAKKEAQLFYQHHLVTSQDVKTNILDTKQEEAHVYYIGAWDSDKKEEYVELAKNKCVLFFLQKADLKANRYDISGCILGRFKTDILPTIGLGCDDNMAFSITNKYENIFELPTEEIANETLLTHYAKYDDDILHLDDFAWIDQQNRKEKQKREKKAGAENKKYKERNKVQENKKEQIEAPSENESEVNNHKRTETDSQREDDDAFNKKLLAGIEAEYRDLLEYLKRQGDSRFNPVQRVVEESLNTCNYEESLAQKYLETLSDYSTELYHRLYNTTERLRKKYVNNLKRKIITCECFNCKEKFDLDVTFEEKGEHIAICPNCKINVMYEVN